MLKLASCQNTGKGRVKDDVRSFVESQYVSVALSPTKRMSSQSIYALTNTIKSPKLQVIDY